MTRTRLTLVLAAALALSGPAFAQQDIDKVNGSITAEAGQAYGDLETVNGSIRLEDGAQAEDASTVNGSIKGGDAVQARSLETVNGSIRLGERARIADDLETVNGSIFIGRGSTVGGDLTTVSGSIGLVDTDLGGSIETVRGDITVGVGSHVKGGIHIEKPTNKGWNFNFGKQRPPRVVIGPDAVVEGPLVFEREVKLYVHDSARIGKVTGATAIAFSTPTPPED
ncbi:MAG TPA: hypothetical protein VFK18_06410 [Luteimonas sp.]|nr:hypothetical protein [Luteimonas sp.]